MSASDDPYRPPTADPTSDSPAERDPTAPRRIVLSWEKLRIYYNLCLLIIGGAGILLTVGAMDTLRLSPLIVGFGLGANVCFFAGPLAELYLTAIHFTDDFRTGRLILFSAGLFISVILVALILVGLAMDPLYRD